MGGQMGKGWVEERCGRVAVLGGDGVGVGAGVEVFDEDGSVGAGAGEGRGVRVGHDEGDVVVSESCL